MYALKIVMYLFNIISSKVVQKTPFELWASRKPSLRHLHVWGCQAEVRIYNSQEKKLDKEQTVDISLVIQKNKKRCMFYCPTIVQESLKLEMFGSLKMVKLMGVMFHRIWRSRKLNYKFL